MSSDEPQRGSGNSGQTDVGVVERVSELLASQEGRFLRQLAETDKFAQMRHDYLLGELSAFFRKNDAQVDEFSSCLDELARVVQEVTPRLGKLEVGQEVLASKLGDLFARLSELEKNYRDVRTYMKGNRRRVVDELQESVAKLSERVFRYDERFDERRRVELTEKLILLLDSLPDVSVLIRVLEALPRVAEVLESERGSLDDRRASETR